MTERRRTGRSHVSYIDTSREYYAAHGYEQPYAWATNDDRPRCLATSATGKSGKDEGRSRPGGTNEKNLALSFHVPLYDTTRATGSRR